MTYKLLILLMMLLSCKSARKDKAVSETFEAVEQVEFELRLAVEREEKSFAQAQDLLNEHCVSCHGLSDDLNLSRYPYASRFPTQEDLAKEIIARAKDPNKPMPPKKPLSSEQIALLENWGTKMATASYESDICKGVVLRLRWWQDQGGLNGQWSQAWDGKRQVRGGLKRMPRDSFVNLEWSVLGEDGREIWSRQYLKIKPNNHSMIFEALLSEDDIRKRTLLANLPRPGNSGVIAVTQAGAKSISIKWEKAIDDDTPAEKLLYSVYMSQKDPLEFFDAIFNQGILVTSGLDLDSAKIDNLKLGESYYVNVIVSDDKGYQAIYKPILQSTLLDDAAPSVTNKEITLADITGTTAKISWVAATDNVDKNADIRYQVVTSSQPNINTVAELDKMGQPAMEPRAGLTEALLKGLVPGNSYYVNVVAIDKSGNRTAYLPRRLTAGKTRSENTVSSYAADCAERLGTLPSFSCFDGQIIPITVNSQPIKPGLSDSEKSKFFKDGERQTCDRPSHFGSGRCAPYSRVGRLTAKGVDGQPLKDVDTVFICRRNVPRLGSQEFDGQTVDGAEFPLFEDINMIQHHRKTGETCFYQVNLEGAENFDGRNVPSPMGDKSDAFWGSPSYTADRRCVRCHDADPFIHTPYIDQVKDASGKPLVPAMDKKSDWAGKYSFLGNRGFEEWPLVYAIFHKDYPQCTSCHNFANRNTVDVYAREATGLVAPIDRSAYGQKQFDIRFWMPPKDAGIKNEAEWNNAHYKDAVEALLQCASKGGEGCSKKLITTLPIPYVL